MEFPPKQRLQIIGILILRVRLINRVPAEREYAKVLLQISCTKSFKLF